MYDKVQVYFQETMFRKKGAESLFNSSRVMTFLRYSESPGNPGDMGIHGESRTTELEKKNTCSGFWPYTRHAF
jgi:hypothetical protein